MSDLGNGIFFIDSFYVEDIGAEPAIDPLVDIPQLPDNIRWASMEPPIEETVRLLGPDSWALGSLMLCKVLDDGCKIPSDIVCSWNDTGKTYYLQQRTALKGDITTEGDPKAGRIEGHAKFHRSIWNLGQNTFCKAKVWVEGLTTEADTINRTITLSKRVSGTKLAEAWVDLETTQRLHIADQVATYLDLLSTWKSEYIETVRQTGYPATWSGGWSLREREALPAVTPRLEPRVPQEEYERFVKRRDAHLGIIELPPNLGEPLILQHLECTPENVFIEMPRVPQEMPQVTALCGWDCVAYFPKYLVATRPRQCRDFMVLTGTAPKHDYWDWQWMLSNACVRLGFPLALEYAKAHSRIEHKHYPGIPVEGLVKCDHLIFDEAREDESISDEDGNDGIDSKVENDSSAEHGISKLSIGH
ncbi:hypothetical protein DL98DRAFT_598740 [Cadophora sp. DSE1049]|nr:hypothetical protein DL98DRAFT_598740 [Cadophora sp. DSE1049]